MLELQRKLLGDANRNKAFHDALKKTIVSGKSIVLDIGSGTGFLSFLAEKLGAKKCILIESGDVAELSKVLAGENGVKNCTFVRGHSSRIPLPKADIIVSETLGNYALEEGIVETLNGARRLLNKGGSMIPSSLKQYACPVTSPRLQRDIDVWNVGFGLDLSAARTISLQNMYVKTLKKDDLLDAGLAAKAWDDIHFLEKNTSLRDATMQWEVKQNLTVYGIALWWEALLAPGVTLSTSPLTTLTHWEQIYLPLLESVQCTKGDTLKLRILSDTRPEVKIRLGWTAELVRGGKVRQSQTLDTNEGLL